MDRYLVTLETIGGLAGVGGIIDFCLYKADKETLKARLEDWWLRFTDVKWSNFGRKEAEAAISILDRLVGSRLWSWKRWRVSVIVGLAVLAISFVWGYAFWTFQPDPAKLLAPPPPIELSEKELKEIAAAAERETLYWVFAIVVVGFAFSLSATRYFSLCFASLCGNSILINALVFICSLVIHYALFLYWTEFWVMMQFIGLLILQFAQFLFENEELRKAALSGIHTLIEAMQSYALSLLSKPRIVWDVSDLLANHQGPVPILMVASALFAVLMGFLANGVRVIFALVFVSSIVFRPFVQEPIARIWYNVLTSGKPFFTTLLGGIGAAFAAIRVLFF